MTTSLLAEQLSAALPCFPFTIHHISTPPTRCHPIYSPAPNASLQRTYVESHFLNVSIRPPPPPHPPPKQEEQSVALAVAIMAIECLIYTTRTLTTLFVSKADSTGFVNLLSLPRGNFDDSPLRTIASTFIRFLVQTRVRVGVKLVVDLFARASDQYLYPGSVENECKHVSDDRQLIKWWCRVLEPLLIEYPAKEKSAPLFRILPNVTSNTASSSSSSFSSSASSSPSMNASAYLLVPGEDAISSFLPSTTRSRWTHGHPLFYLSSTQSSLNRNLPPRCLIPHFPDDPKGRFVDELDDELPNALGAARSAPILRDPEKAADGREAGAKSPSKRGVGAWKSVKSLDAFWEIMAFRSECSSGRLVGFVWVVVEKNAGGGGGPVPVLAPVDECAQQSESQSSMGYDEDEDEEEVQSYSGKQRKESPSRKQKPKPKKKVRYYEPRVRAGIVTSRFPRIKPRRITTSARDVQMGVSSSSVPSSSVSSVSPALSSTLPTNTPYFIWPSDSRGSLILDQRQYDKAGEVLQHLDFATLSVASKSTHAWIEQVGVLGGSKSSEWGVQIFGRKDAGKVDDNAAAAATTAERPSNGVNVLSGVKRKKQSVQLGEDDRRKTVVLTQVLH